MDKTCPKCAKTLPLDSFNWKNKAQDLRDTYCRQCRKETWDGYYATESVKVSHRKAVKKYNLGRRRDVQKLIREAKSQPCADCKQNYPYYVMDLDHRGGEDKLYNVGQMTNKTIRQVQEEIAKCDVVCANCHRIRTHMRRTGAIV